MLTPLSNSGIWAPTLRYDDTSKAFWLVTTLVHDKRAYNDATRWDNVGYVFFRPGDCIIVLTGYPGDLRIKGPVRSLGVV